MMFSSDEKKPKYHFNTYEEALMHLVKIGDHCEDFDKFPIYSCELPRAKGIISDKYIDNNLSDTFIYEIGRCGDILSSIHFDDLKSISKIELIAKGFGDGISITSEIHELETLNLPIVGTFYNIIYLYIYMEENAPRPKVYGHYTLMPYALRKKYATSPLMYKERFIIDSSRISLLQK